MEGSAPWDVAIVGGGLAGGLIALALERFRPELRVLLIEAAPTLGGNHIWSFFPTDLGKRERELVEPLIGWRWDGHHVVFPRLKRRLGGGYRSIPSERFDRMLNQFLPAGHVLTGTRVLAVSPTAAVLADGRRIEARAVIDARGAEPGYAGLARLDLGWQKFVGREVVLPRPHGLKRPVVMDASVAQLDGYRFVYLLPFDERTLFVEDTYYSDTPDLDVPAVTRRIDAYLAMRGWTGGEPGRVETGVLPVVLGGDFEGYWAAGGAGVPKAGVRAGLFHPTTGYSLPDAARTAMLIARTTRFDAASLHTALHEHAAKLWAERGFYRLLDRMLFRAAEPDQRFRVMQRFYALDESLVLRFYAGTSTLSDKLRIVAGRPPVPMVRAIRAAIGGTSRGRVN